MEIRALILCGGESRRMGRDKAALSCGGAAFWERIAAALTDYAPLLSVRTPEAHPEIPLPHIIDLHGGCGPMDGIASAFDACSTEALLCVSCDLPLVSPALAQLLTAACTADCDALVPVTADGRMHPLCAVYRRSAAAVFNAQLSRGNYRMTDALPLMRTRLFPVPVWAEKILAANINDPAQYRQFCAEQNEKAVKK